MPKNGDGFHGLTGRIMGKTFGNIIGLAAALLIFPAAVPAAEVRVVGLTAGKAVLIIDGGKPRTLSEGEAAPGGVRLLKANTDFAIVEIDGKRQKLSINDTVAYAAPPVISNTVTLVSDGNGHYFTTGTINGATVRFIVDTGATMVTMGAEDAYRAGVNYLSGTLAYSQTANGVVPVYKVKLDNVKLGDITLRNVDGAVHHQAEMPVVLLGMSFLNQLEMRRQGSNLTLTKPK
jgi:aspartyl protease family protein